MIYYVNTLHIKNAQITVAGFNSHGGGAVGVIQQDIGIVVYGVGGSTIILETFGGMNFAPSGGSGAVEAPDYIVWKRARFYVVRFLVLNKMIHRVHHISAAGFFRRRPLATA